MSKQLDKALELIGRVALAIAKRPDELRMSVERTEGTVEVTFTANPGDTRRLVGKQADNLKQLAALFRLLARDSGLAVRLCDLISNENPAPPFEGYQPKEDWNREGIERLLREITEAVFQLPVVVETEVHTPFSVKMYAIIQGDMEGNRVLSAYDKIINILFIPIGTNAGMKVYAHAHDWTKNRAAGGVAAVG